MAGTSTPVSEAPKIFLTIDDSPDFGYMFSRFEWRSFTNGGYIIRCKLQDPYWQILLSLINDYLRKGRKEPTKVVFELSWPSSGSTGKHLAFMADLDARGIQSGGGLEFIAIDPPSYWLNAGDSAGSVYKGKVSDVMKKVVNDYFVGPNGPYGGGAVQVSETQDSNQGMWYMMRQDPKTFLGSMIDWASSITAKKTNYIVSSDGFTDNGPPSIWIKEQAERQPANLGTFVVDRKTPAANDTYNFEFLSDNVISVFQKTLITSGMSAISERYLDRKTGSPPHTGQDSDCIVHVHDENTANKKKANIGPEQGFAKPGSPPTAKGKPHEWSTHVMAIPQHNAGDVGLTYDKYIDGRARGLFLNMLNLVMRIKVRVTGEPSRTLAVSHNLGVSKLTLLWSSGDNKPYFMGGDWLVYGFHHSVTRGEWHTDLYCARLDYDANAVPV